MTIRRLWFVLPLDLVQDQNRGEFGPEVDMGIQEAPQPRNRGLGRNVQVNLGEVPEPVGNQPPVGSGFYLDAVSRKQFEKAYTTEDFAITSAKERAEKEPRRPFGVFSCVGVYETTVPTVIEKEFNENGELRLVGK